MFAVFYAFVTFYNLHIVLVRIGSKVYLRHSGETGVITALLENNMVSVLLDSDDMEIPAFTDDIIPADQHTAQKTRTKPAAALHPTPDDTTVIGNPGSNTGLHLSFDPILRGDATAEQYRIFLTNDTPNPLLVSYQRSTASYPRKKQITKKVEAHTALHLERIPFDELNEQIAIQFECCRLRTDGTGPRHTKSLRVKPKVFFKKMATDPILGRPVHFYTLFPVIKDDRPTEQSSPSENLRSYTKKNLRQRKAESNLRNFPDHEVEEFASFLPELDLHIEMLVHNPKSYTAADILQIQLEHFDEYLDNAIRLGVERVFVIHGLGKGRLRKSIAQRLKHNQQVIDFRNEYHPNYGFGATEVVLR